MIKRIVFTLLCVLILTFVFCNPAKDDKSGNTEQAADAGYGGTLVVAVTGDIDTFNPLFSRSSLGQDVNHLLMLGLADLDDKGNFVPELAESWERSPDFLKITYHLRKNAKWSDGEPVSAYDVKFTFDVLMDTTVGSPRQGSAEYIKSVTVKDSSTVVFEFVEAYPDQMFDTAGEILPEHLLKDVPRNELAVNEFGRNPISSGPFVLNKWVSKQYIELTPNETYFGGRPYLDKLIFKVVPNSTNQMTQLQTGEVDMLLDVAPEKVGQLASNNNIQIYDVPGRVYNYVGYNEQNPLFSSVAVRRALTMAIDRHKIIDALLFGYGKACISSFPPTVGWAYDDQIAELPYDPAKARQLLEQEGWKDSDGDGWLDKDGKKFEFSIKTNAGNALRSDLAVIIQDQLKQVGIKADIRTLEWTTLLDEMRKRNFDAYIGGLSTSLYVDPTPIYHSSSVNLFNYVGYADPEVDALIEKGRVEMDREKAAITWKKVQELIYADQPYTYLFWIDKVVAVNKHFRNVTPVTLSALYQVEKWYRIPG